MTGGTVTSHAGRPDTPAVNTATVVIDLGSLYEHPAKLRHLPEYLRLAMGQAGEGTEVVLTGSAPVWLYLSVAHALHGKARRLAYRSPVTGDVPIFEHDPH